MLKDRYGCSLSTDSSAARDAYITAVDLYLAAQVGAEQAYEQAIAADPNFALAHLGLARHYQVNSQPQDAKQSLATAQNCTAALSAREAGQLQVLGLLIEGKSQSAHTAARSHLLEFPLDALVAQTCLGVFSLIGFSGKLGREAEALALSLSLAPHYGDDWWFLSALSFSQTEVGQTSEAERNIERSISLNPNNANAAHHRAHLYYELGESQAGFEYLEHWVSSYDRRGLLHCHLSWHVALWALLAGDTDTLWQRIDTDIAPGVALGPPINVLTDTAALYYRAELAGVPVTRQRWQSLSEFAHQRFPKPGVAFADIHTALADAMSGESGQLTELIENSAGPAAEVVQLVAEGFKEIANGNWAAAVNQLSRCMHQHERLGGSRAQRDLIDYALLSCLMRLGKKEEAQRLLLMRRPLTDTKGAIKGLT